MILWGVGGRERSDAPLGRLGGGRGQMLPWRVGRGGGGARCSSHFSSVL